jgi:AMP-binding enzyme
MNRFVSCSGSISFSIREGNHPDDYSRLTYRKLLEEVCRFANVLKMHGVNKGDRVSVYMPMVCINFQTESLDFDFPLVKYFPDHGAADRNARLRSNRCSSLDCRKFKVLFTSPDRCSMFSRRISYFNRDLRTRNNEFFLLLQLVLVVTGF